MLSTSAIGRLKSTVFGKSTAMAEVTRNTRRFLVAAAVVWICVWFPINFLSTDAHHKTAIIHSLQREAEELFNTRAVTVYNYLANNVEFLRRFHLLNPVPTHREMCAPPSLRVRYLPVIGHTLLESRFQAYTVCMKALLGRTMYIRVILILILSLVAIIPVLAVYVRVQRCLKRSRQLVHKKDRDLGDRKDTKR